MLINQSNRLFERGPPHPAGSPRIIPYPGQVSAPDGSKSAAIQAYMVFSRGKSQSLCRSGAERHTRMQRRVVRGILARDAGMVNGRMRALSPALPALQFALRSVVSHGGEYPSRTTSTSHELRAQPYSRTAHRTCPRVPAHAPVRLAPRNLEQRRADARHEAQEARVPPPAHVQLPLHLRHVLWGNPRVGWPGGALYLQEPVGAQEPCSERNEGTAAVL